MSEQYKLIQGDCVEKMRELPDNSIDSVVTDPPYELGFMGKSWDASGIAYSVEMWKQVHRVLKPGGYVLSFGGSRTYHRMASAIEDAGFEIRDQMMWVYGSGFPKSHNVGNDIDKRMGHPARGKAIPMASTHFPTGKYAEGQEKLTGNKVEAFEARSEEGKPWQGWGTALKPAHEPICIARKPIEGTVAANVLKWGVGAINIDACRVSADGENFDHVQDRTDLIGKCSIHHEGGNAEALDKLKRLGRFPANLVHDGSQEVLDLFPETKSGKMKQHIEGGSFNVFGKQYPRDVETIGDAGSAARFFYCSKASKKDRNEGCEHLEAKPFQTNQPYGDGAEARAEGNTKGSKNNHPTVKPNDLMRYLTRLVTPVGGTVLDPFNGSGSTGKAAVLEGFKYIGIEKDEEYIKIAEARISATLKK